MSEPCPECGGKGYVRDNTDGACNACKVESEFGGPEDPHPIPRRFHTCKPLHGSDIRAPKWETAYQYAEQELIFAGKAIDDTADWSGSSGNWPLQQASSAVHRALDSFKSKSKQEYIHFVLSNTPPYRAALGYIFDVMEAHLPESKELKAALGDVIRFGKWLLTDKDY